MRPAIALGAMASIALLCLGIIAGGRQISDAESASISVDQIDPEMMDMLEPDAEAPAADNGFGGALASWLGAARPSPGTLYHEALAAFERPLFEHALHETGGNQLRAAQLLGINRNTLRKRLDDLEIDPEVFAHRN